MGTLIAKDKDVVVPGEVLAEGMDFVAAPGTFREGDKVIASRLGLLNVDGRLLKLIPLSGKYLPQNGDLVIGKVIDIALNGWRLEINSAYSAMLTLKDATSQFIERGADLTRFFNIGDYIIAKIVNVTSQYLVDLTMKGPGLRKLTEGRIITVSATKVPRIIGKAGSMLTMIREYTGCHILVGQNGMVWIQGEPAKEIIAVDTIRKIEAEAHINGLTDRIKEFLEKNGIQKKD